MFIDYQYYMKMPYQAPSHYQPVYTPEQVQQRTAAMGREMGPWAHEVSQKTNSQLLAICVMRGGMFFYADLVRHMPCSVEMGFCHISIYSKGEVGKKAENETYSLDSVKPQGRTIVLIDEICDSGKTLLHLKNYCLEMGAVDVRSAVLVHRLRPDSAYRPDYIGFEYPEKYWLVGYGMDDSNRYANMPGVFYIPGTSSY